MGSSNSHEELKHLVIVGGSFAGFNLLQRVKNNFKITLIDMKEFFEWICSAPHSMLSDAKYFNDKATVDFHKMVEVDKVFGNNVTFVQGLLDELVDEHTIKIKRTQGKYGDQMDSVESEEIEFDYLAICTGASYMFDESILDIYTKEDRAALYEKYQKDIEKAKSVLVVGGGPTGVETIGELLMKYRNTKMLGIVTNGDHLLVGYPNKAGNTAQNHFEKKGVKVYTQTRYESSSKLAEDYEFILKWVGLHFHSEYLNANFKDFKDNRGRIYVNEFFQLTNVNPCELPKDEHIPANKVLRNVFCYGDAALTRMNEIKNVPTIREMSYIVANNLKESQKENPKLKEMPYAVHFISGVYYDKYSGTMTMNRWSLFNCCQYKNKESFVDFYIKPMKNQTCGKCQWWTYNCQMNSMGCCLNMCCCGCANQAQKKKRREELKKLFKEEV